MTSEQIANEIRQMAERIAFLGASMARLGANHYQVSQIAVGARLIADVCDKIDEARG